MAFTIEDLPLPFGPETRNKRQRFNHSAKSRPVRAWNTEQRDINEADWANTCGGLVNVVCFILNGIEEENVT